MTGAGIGAGTTGVGRRASRGDWRCRTRARRRGRRRRLRCLADAIEIVDVLLQLGDASGFGLALALARETVLGAARRRRRRGAALAQLERVGAGTGGLLLVVDRCRDAAAALALVRLGHRRGALRRCGEALAIGAEIGALRGDRLARLARRDRLGGFSRGHGEDDARLEAIHVVAAEGARIGAEQRHQHLVERHALSAACGRRSSTASRPSEPGIRRPTSLPMRPPTRAHGPRARCRRGPWLRRRRCVPRPCARALRRAPLRAARVPSGGRPAVGGSGVGAGGAAEITGDVVVPGAGVAPARIVAGGSNSRVYSRTRRPVAHEISRMTSTKGSCTPRSLTRRTNRRPSARFSNDARVLGSTGL